MKLCLVGTMPDGTKFNCAQKFEALPQVGNLIHAASLYEDIEDEKSDVLRIKWMKEEKMLRVTSIVWGRYNQLTSDLDDTQKKIEKFYYPQVNFEIV